MQQIRLGLLLGLILGTPNLCFSQVTVYRPLGQELSPLALWQTTLQRAVVSSQPTPGSGSRPVLPGLRPVENELLVDALLRKQPRKLQGDPLRAQQSLRALAEKGLSPTQNRRLFPLYGEMAEALYLHRHPDWNYVRKPNAPQNDVWKMINDRGHKIGGQVKYKFRYEKSAPRYFRDMMSDYKASRFIIPDDHVGPLRQYIEVKYQTAKAAGDLHLSERLAIQKQRVKPLGYDSSEVVSKTNQAIRTAATESYASYVSIGAGLALSIGQAGWAYSRGYMTFDQASHTAAKGVALIGSGMIADQVLVHAGGELLRGTLRGNALVGLAILVVDTSWSIAERGGRAAFQDPSFYTQFGGSLSAITVGTAVGLLVTGYAIETGPIAAPIIGTVAGAVSGTAAFLAGSYATNEFMREFYPALYTSERKRLLAVATTAASERLSELQAVPVIATP